MTVLMSNISRQMPQMNLFHNECHFYKKDSLNQDLENQ